MLYHCQEVMQQRSQTSRIQVSTELKNCMICATSTYHAHCEKIFVFVFLLFWIQQHAVCLPTLQSQMFDPLRTHWRAKYLFTKTIKCHKNVMDYLSKAILRLCFHIALKELRPIAAWKVENRCKSMLLKVVRNNEPLVCRTMAGH